MAFRQIEKPAPLSSEPSDGLTPIYAPNCGAAPMIRKNVLSTLLGLTGAVFGSMVGYCGSVRATEARIEYMRLSTAYEGYVSSLAQSMSAS